MLEIINYFGADFYYIIYIENLSNVTSSEDFCKKIIKTYHSPNTEIKFNKTVFGKPYISNIDGLYISISHKSSYIIIGVSNVNIGVDIEKIEQVNLRVAKKIFTPLELEYLIKSKEEIDFHFYKIWATKEALFKRDGKCPVSDIFKINTVNVKTCHDYSYKDYIILICF